MLAKLGTIVNRALSRTTPFTNVVGVAQSLLALSSLSTLLLNRVDTLFRPVYSLGEAPFCYVPVERACLYCLAGPHHLIAARLAGCRRLVGRCQWLASACDSHRALVGVAELLSHRRVGRRRGSSGDGADSSVAPGVPRRPAALALG